jgi:hypothetical protein
VVLREGSHFCYFQTFVLFDDLNTLVCNLLAPTAPGLSFLQPLQQALTGAGTPFNCSSQFAAFNAAQLQGSSPAGGALSGVARAAQQLNTQAYQALTAPQAAPPSGVGGLINSLLGAGGGAVAGVGGGSGGSSNEGSGGSGGGLLGGSGNGGLLGGLR